MSLLGLWVHSCEWVTLLQSISGGNNNVHCKLSPCAVPRIQNWILNKPQFVRVHGWEERSRVFI